MTTFLKDIDSERNEMIEEWIWRQEFLLYCESLDNYHPQLIRISLKDYKRIKNIRE